MKSKPLSRGKSRLKVKPKKPNSELDNYFEYHIKELTLHPYSEASGNKIASPTKTNVCHIFPKRKYKSIQSHLDNCVYLTWEEHQKFDRLMDVFDLEAVKKEFPELWEKVWKRAKVLLPLISEKGKLIEAFEIYA